MKPEGPKSEYDQNGRANTSAEGESESTASYPSAEGGHSDATPTDGHYRNLVENANDILFTLDLEGNMTSINKAAEWITGYSQTELLGMNMAEFLTPESVTNARQMMARKLAGEERTHYEVDVRTKDGRPLTLEINSRLALKDGFAVGVQGVARDISARRRTEEALREADRRALSAYERLLERISRLAQALGTARELVTIFRALRDFTLVSVPCDGLFISLYDPIREVRIACYALGDNQEIDTSGLPPMPVTSRGPNSRAVTTGQVIITDDYMRVTQGHPSMILGPDNGLRPQASLALPMAVMGRIIGTIEVQSYQKGAFRDEHVTAMRMAANLTAVAIENVRLLERESQARAAAEDSNRLKDEFLATVSHELRTPLTAILGWSRMLASGSLEDSMADRAIETIVRNAKAQSQIIDDILDVSRVITGKLYLELHPIELAPVIEAAINVVRPTAEAKGIDIEIHFEPRPAVIMGDSNRLQQVIWNLVSNAIKFTPRGGRVKLTMLEIGSRVEIKVSDSGQGISRDFLPFVVDRFRQADSTSTRQHGGLGLGLSIARHLVAIHEGAIKAESAGEGKGASFSFSVPLIASRTTRQQFGSGEDINERPKHQRRLRSLRVLLVADDEDTLDLLRAALKQTNAKVTPASSAEEAMEAFRLAEFDVVVSDIAMPGEDGYQLIQRIRTSGFAGSSIPAVAITAYAKDEDRQKALSAGYQTYLAKPIELSELVTAIAKAVENSRE